MDEGPTDKAFTALPQESEFRTNPNNTKMGDSAAPSNGAGATKDVDELGRGNSAVIIDKVITVLMVMIQLFNVLMASLLVLFIPQQCDPIPGAPVNTIDALPHPCSVTELFQNVSHIQAGALAINFVTLTLMLIHEWFVWRREMWMIKHFDDDDFYTDENLGNTLKLEHYAEIHGEFNEHNKRVLATSITCILLCIINVPLSGFVIFHRGTGSHTYTTFATYALLLVTVFKGVISNSYKGFKEGRGFSNIQTEPFQWNMIHKNFAHKGQFEDTAKYAEQKKKEEAVIDKEEGIDPNDNV